MKRLTVTYDDVQSFEYDQELQKKGQAFDEFNDFLRSCIKYDSYKEFLTKLELEHKVTDAALNDIVYKTCYFLRNKLNNINNL